MKLEKAIFRIIKLLFFLLPISRAKRESLSYSLKARFFSARNKIRNWRNQGAVDKKYIDYVLKNTNLKENCVEFTKKPYIRKDNDPKILAYYLTQFSPCKQNDEWWGKGVTEWNNVSRAVPMYTGHYQPRLPGELGFYDLRILENMQRQADLAKQYGVYGFCFYYYWFEENKRLLETALDLFVNNIDFPFSLCWANESWTSKFDGTSTKILMKQVDTIENYTNVITDLAQYFTNKNYIKVNNRNLFTVYRPSKIPDVKKVITSWRDYCRRNNLPDLYLVAVLETDAQKDWTTFGFDASTEFQPGTSLREFNEITTNYSFLDKNFSGNVYDMEEFVTSDKCLKFSFNKLFRAAMPMWDNSARRFNRGLIFEKSSPDSFKTWLKKIFEDYKNRNDLDDEIVFINAWNEWGEGAYLEPDKRHGYAYLQALKEAIEENRN